jgi:exosortase E/protease (VPEID-CTERM system)
LRARWPWLGLLLTAEVVGLTLGFDAEKVAAVPAGWARLVVGAHFLPQVAVAVAAATFFFGGRRLRREYGEVRQAAHAWPAWPFLLGHLAAFAGFAVLTGVVLEGDVAASSAPGLWAAALWPANLWLPLARRGAGALAVGVVVGVAAWGAGRFTDVFWEPLSRSTFQVVHALLGVVTHDLVCEPENLVVGTSAFQVCIAPECSGYEGVGLMWVFLGAWLWLCRAELRFSQALLLVPLATAVVWLANGLRIAALVAVGTWGSEAVARGGFHSQAGWLAFNAVALGVMALAQRVRWFARCPAAAAAGGKATAAWLGPMLVLAAALMVTAAFTSGFDYFYPVRVLATAAALGYWWRRYTGLQWSWSWTAAGIGAAVYALWLALEPPARPGADAAFAAALRSLPPAAAGLWLVFRVAGSVVTVPLAEELAFRGYLTRRLISPDFENVPPGRFTWVSFLVSSALFGALHGRCVAGTLAGMLDALALYRRRNLADAVLAHGLTNALLAAHVLATGAWSLWS